MEENIALVLYGCNLAKHLENNIPNLTNQPDLVLASCEEIIRVFSSIRDRLLLAQCQISLSNFNDLITMTQPQEIQRADDAMINALDSTSTSTSKAKRRRRKDAVGERVVVMVPAPQMGNLDHPPEDGNIWRKYGQKEILGSKYPRSYYRCTHQKLSQCPAKKHVQRLDDNPFTFQVTYRGSHTCHVQPPPTTVQPPPASNHYYSNPIITSATTTTTTASFLPLFDPTFNDQCHHHHHHHHHQVAEMAHAMFNPERSSSCSSMMDLIFPPDHHSHQDS